MFTRTINSLIVHKFNVTLPLNCVKRSPNTTRLISGTRVDDISGNEKDARHDVTNFISKHSDLNDPAYISSLQTNALRRRKAHADIDSIQRLWKSIKSSNEENAGDLVKELQQELLKLPNSTQERCRDLEGPVIIEEFGEKRTMKDPLTLEKVSHHGIDTLDTGNFTGHRSYYLRGSMAQLEHQLIRFAVNELQKEGFKLMSVPDLVTEDVLSGCGTPVDRDCPMVYYLQQFDQGPMVCLSGTAEMALAGWLRGRHLRLADLPLKLCAVSRCHRYEANSTAREHGIFRVHNFTKVEMFGVTANETGRESEDLYNELLELQKRLHGQLGLHGQVVLMPPEELGNPAHSKTDLEVWLPGRGFYAELTSASNCTDYQAKRLDVSYTNDKGETRLVHTVNGTAIAVPRCIIALCETHQQEDGRRSIRLPKVLGVRAQPQQKKSDMLKTNNDENNSRISEEHEFLDKIMTFGEQCSRSLLDNRNLQIDE